MKTTIIASLIMVLLFAVLTFGSQVGAQTPSLTPTATHTPTPEPTDTPKPQKQEELPPGPVRNLSVSPANRQLEVTWDAPPSPLYGPGVSYYQYRYRASGRSWSSWRTIYRTSATIGSLVNGQRYQAQVIACNSAGCSSASTVSGTPISIPTATPTPTNTPIPLPDPPTGLRISLDPDHNRRIEVSYKRSESPHYYVFELLSSSSEDGNYSDRKTQKDRSSPVRFNNLTLERWYKVRGWNCLDSGRQNCGDPSAFTRAIELPKIDQPTATPTPTATSTPTATPTPSSTSTATTTPLWAELSSSKEYPKSKDTVTLTAKVVGAPTDGTLTYQWQTKNGGTWSNYGSVTTSDTIQVTSDTRGTKMYRVVATHSSGATGASLPFHVSWDELAIVAEMLKAMAAEVDKKSDYTTAQSALAKCMTANLISGEAPTPPFNTLDDVLSRYTGAVKAVAETTCATQLDSVLQVVESESSKALNTLKTGSTAKSIEYAALLETEHGKRFEQSVGAPNIVKQYAHLLSTEPIDAQDNEGVSGQGGSVPPSGLTCMPDDGSEPSTLYGKMRVLNCLIFQTPHSFWAGATYTALKAAIDKEHEIEGGETTALNAWLGYGDEVCTKFADSPVTFCRKHDVAFDSLQKFIEDSELENRANELDESWNPRNKHLADAEFHSDIYKYGCEENDPGNFIANEGCGLRTKLLANFMHWGVSKLNNKSWPVTTHDFDDTSTNNRFRGCAIPRITNVTTSSSSSLTLRNYTVQWEYEPGCVSSIAVDHYKLCWERKALGVLTGVDICEIANGEETEHTLKVPIIDVGSYTFRSAEIRPKDVVYGGLFGFNDISTNVELLSFLIDYPFAGVYYPKQVFP